MKTIGKIIGAVGLLPVIVFAEGIKEGELNRALTQAASQINANLPMMVDSGTRLDSTAGLNREFRYNNRGLDFYQLVTILISLLLKRFRSEVS